MELSLDRAFSVWDSGSVSRMGERDTVSRLSEHKKKFCTVLHFAHSHKVSQEIKSASKYVQN